MSEDKNRFNSKKFLDITESASKIIHSNKTWIITGFSAMIPVVIKQLKSKL